MQRIYFDDNNSDNNITTITIKVVWKKRLKYENSILTIIYYKKLELKNLIIKAKYFVIAIQANTNYWNKIYKIYNYNQILLKIIKTIKSTINLIRLQQIQIAYKIIKLYKTRLKVY